MMTGQKQASQVEAAPANINTNTPNALSSSELPPLQKMQLTQPGTRDSLSCPSVASPVRALNALTDLHCPEQPDLWLCPKPWPMAFGEGVFAFKLSPEFLGPV